MGTSLTFKGIPFEDLINMSEEELASAEFQEYLTEFDNGITSRSTLLPERVDKENIQTKGTKSLLEACKQSIKRRLENDYRITPPNSSRLINLELQLYIQTSSMIFTSALRENELIEKSNNTKELYDNQIYFRKMVIKSPIPEWVKEKLIEKLNLIESYTPSNEPIFSDSNSALYIAQNSEYIDSNKDNLFKLQSPKAIRKVEAELEVLISGLDTDSRLNIEGESINKSNSRISYKNNFDWIKHTQTLTSKLEAIEDSYRKEIVEETVLKDLLLDKIAEREESFVWGDISVINESTIENFLQNNDIMNYYINKKG